MEVATYCDTVTGSLLLWSERKHLPSRKTRLTPCTTYKRKTEQEMKENDRGGSWNSRKDLERGEGKRW